MADQGPVGECFGGPLRAAEIDLGLALDRTAPLALPDQLEGALRAMVERGELLAGARLPSTRVLAVQLGVSRGVVVEAYDRLARQGVLVTRQGAVVRVAAAVTPREPRAEPPSSVAEAAPAHAWRVRLHPALAPAETLDRRAWRALLRDALAEATDEELRSVDHAGQPRLRAALATQLARSRGVSLTPQDVVITSGVTHALTALAPLLRGRGPVAVEEPGFLLHRATLAAAGCELRLIRSDADGIDVGALEASGARSVLVTPAHQMPRGTPMSAARRAALLHWAQRAEGLVLEDDYDGEVRYDRRSVRALQALDPARVLYLGTTSKVLSPAVRVGWMVIPAADQAGAALLATLAGGAPGNVEQLALALALERGAFDRAAARLRRRCAAQRRALTAALAQSAPHLRPEGVEAGLVLTLRAPGADASALVAAAAARGVELFAQQDGADALLLVGFGEVREPRAEEVAADLAAITTPMAGSGRADVAPSAVRSG